MDDGFAGFSGLKIGVSGLGLIGGSLAKAFKKKGFCVSGYDADGEVIAAAVASGAIDGGGTKPDLLYDCDLIFVALYPEGIIDFVKRGAPHFKKGCVVVDCCGIKGHVCGELYGENLGGDFTFIGGHPMAGTEKSGFSASFGEMFLGASFILAPRENEDERIIKNLRSLLLFIGFGRVVITTPRRHDRMIAFTSQLPHVLACSYVLSPCCPHHDGFSAGSFKDVSRVAHINPALWTELFIDNKTELCAEIDLMIEHMSAIRTAISASDAKTLCAILQKSRLAKDSCGEQSAE